MSTEPSETGPLDHPGEGPFDPVRERERILAQVRGVVLDAHQAEFVCATLAMLAEMGPGDTPFKPDPPR
jgi:hypothetical protein